MLLFAAFALAAPTTLTFDDPAELDAWTLASDGGSDTLADGALTVETPAGAERTWFTDERDPDSGWHGVRSRNGWWVAADVDILADCLAVYLEAGDDNARWYVRVGDDEVAVGGPVATVAAIDTSVPHTIGIFAEAGGTAQVRVDGVAVLHRLYGQRGGGALGFGNDAICDATTTWTELRFDTFYEGRGDDDDDGDGVVNRDDDCFEEFDPTQDDADGDGAGDACDPCPDSAPSDTGDEGLCGDSADTGRHPEPEPVDCFSCVLDPCCGDSSALVLVPLTLLAFRPRPRRS
jgi:hypothetical protein